MILTVTLNAAIDKTHLVPEFQAGRVNRPRRVIVVAGGKGLNVARVLTALGRPVLATGIVAGHTGTYIEDCLEAEAIPHEFHRLSQGESRTCLAIVQPGAALTELNEDGAHVDAREFELFVARYEKLLPAANWVALSGSLPPGLSGEAYVRLMTLARQAGKRISLDTSGPALGVALTGGPDVVKPNQQEAEAALGFAVTPESVPRALSDFLALGARTVALTLGGLGAVVANRDEAWFIAAPEVEVVNPVGSGDSFLAGLLTGLNAGAPLPEAARLAVACGSANAAVPGAAACAREHIDTLIARVRPVPLAEAPWQSHPIR